MVGVLRVVADQPGGEADAEADAQPQPDPRRHRGAAQPGAEVGLGRRAERQLRGHVWTVGRSRPPRAGPGAYEVVTGHDAHWSGARPRLAGPGPAPAGASASRGWCWSWPWSLVVALVVRRDPPVEPVAQDRPGPVLLVPGYGGSTASLQVLADALTAEGRDARIVRPAGSGTQDLRDQAADLGDAVDAALDETGAPSVDLVGYSAGGVVVRLYVADLGGGSHVRRAVTLASPHHGTDLAALAGSLGQHGLPRGLPAAGPRLRPAAPAERRRRDAGRAGLGGAVDRGRRDRGAARLRLARRRAGRRPCRTSAPTLPGRAIPTYPARPR